jgi:hypothetical protein
MEGKVTHQRTLSKVETEKIFKAMIEWNDQFIGVSDKSRPIPPLLSTKPQITASSFHRVRTATALSAK